MNSSSLSRLVVASCVAMTATAARAVSTGGMFAGPTRATGASLFWNPAAVVSLDDDSWAVLVDATGSLIHVEYQRAGIDPNSDTGDPFELTEFRTVSPDLNITVTGPTPIPDLRFVLGTFSPNLLGATWPEDGPQRLFGTTSLFVTYSLSAGVAAKVADKYGFAVLGGPFYGTLTLRNAIDFGAYANGLLGTDLFALEKPLLEGDSELTADGWSFVGLLGAWAEPAAWLRVGVGFMIPLDLVMEGEVTIQTAEAVQQALPGFNLVPRGDVVINYPMPWQLNAEAEVALGAYRVALMFQFIKKSVQDIILASVVNARPGFIEGERISVKGVRDDWMLSLRVTRLFDEDLEVGLRLGVDPRYVPDETLNPTNLDFTKIHLSAGARWKISDTVRMTGTYSFVYLVDYTIRNSIFNPRVPSDSGLALPPANGHYSGDAHMLALGVEWVWDSD